MSKKQNNERFTNNASQAVTVSRSILGIDPSLSSNGWCLLEENKAVTGVIGSKLQGPARLCDLRKRVSSLIDLCKPTLVVLEGYSYGSPTNREALAEWGGVLRCILWEREIPTLVVAPSTLKKFVLDGGGTEKERMMLASYKRWGREFATNDECDAHALARLGEARLRLESDPKTALPIRMVEASFKAAVLIPAPSEAKEIVKSTPIRRRK